jgi:putative membrane protein
LIPVLGVPLAVLGYRRFRWSDSSYVQATLLLILHAIGAHYTYSVAPIGEWMRDALLEWWTAIVADPSSEGLD